MNESQTNHERKVLFQTDSFEVVSIQWTNKTATELHNHGWGQCHVLIEEGVFENHLDLGIKKESRILEPGQVVSTPAGAKHEMVCKSQTGKTLHVYTPKVSELKESGKFSVAQIANLKSELALSEPTDSLALARLLAVFQSQSITTHSPYFMNQLFSGVLPQMLMAEEFITQTKTTLATFEASSIFSTMEAEVVESLGQQIGWAEGSRSGVSVPGGSAANFMAVHCARQKLLPLTKAKGLSGQALKVFVSAEAHYSFKKALAVLGIGIDNLVQIPVDQKGCMNAEALKDSIQQYQKAGDLPLMVAATAGTTVLGAFDELTSLAAVCKEHDIWFHVDGAWGGPALFSKKLRPLLRGIELADSMTFDAHKLFGATLTSSFFLTKHSDILLKANDVAGGDYLFHSEDENLDRGQLSWQCGRKADAASFWTIWKSVGTGGLGSFVDRLLSVRDETVHFIKSEPRLELVGLPDYLNVCVRVLPHSGQQNSNWSKTVREKLKDADLAMVNYASDKSGSFLRLILAHPYLNFSHVHQILLWALDVK
jgi:glutamate/tyrosine decarboxylase-like PLP-dependent enzyme/quercetin dioxygenase-like cupin family protein